LVPFRKYILKPECGLKIVFRVQLRSLTWPGRIVFYERHILRALAPVGNYFCDFKLGSFLGPTRGISPVRQKVWFLSKLLPKHLTCVSRFRRWQAERRSAGAQWRRRSASSLMRIASQRCGRHSMIASQRELRRILRWRRDPTSLHWTSG